MRSSREPSGPTNQPESDTDCRPSRQTALNVRICPQGGDDRAVGGRGGKQGMSTTNAGSRPVANNCQKKVSLDWDISVSDADK